MNYETIMYILIGAGVVCLTLAIIMFFALRIPSVLGELTGRTARKEIARLKENDSVRGSAKTARKTRSFRLKGRTTEPLPVVEPPRVEANALINHQEDTVPLLKEARGHDGETSTPYVNISKENMGHDQRNLSTVALDKRQRENFSDDSLSGERTEELPRNSDFNGDFTVVTDITLIHTSENI